MLAGVYKVWDQIPKSYDSGSAGSYRGVHKKVSNMPKMAEGVYL